MEYLFKILPPMLEGTVTTILLFALVLLLSLPLGFFIMLLAQAKFPPVSMIARAYIYVVRGTPLLLQLFFVYFGLPLIPFVGQYLLFERFQAALITFALNYAAYFAEIFRGGILSIDHGQYEAAKVLGLSRFQTTSRIIIPQMLRVALPSIGNEAVTLVKDTALISAIAVPELLHFAKTAVNRDNNLSAFLVAAVIYLICNLILTFFLQKIERKTSY